MLARQRTDGGFGVGSWSRAQGAEEAQLRAHEEAQRLETQGHQCWGPTWVEW